jgi:hypothetical protein
VNGKNERTAREMHDYAKSFLKQRMEVHIIDVEFPVYNSTDCCIKKYGKRTEEKI